MKAGLLCQTALAFRGLVAYGFCWLQCIKLEPYSQQVLEVKTHSQRFAVSAVVIFFFFGGGGGGLQDSCPFLSSKRAFRTPDEPEVRRNNGLVCMQ